MFKFVSKMIKMAKEQSPAGDDEDIKVVSKVVSTSESPDATVEIITLDGDEPMDVSKKKVGKIKVEEEIIFCATINRNTI